MTANIAINTLVKLLTWLASPLGLLFLCVLLSVFCLRARCCRRFRGWAMPILTFGLLQLFVLSLPVTADYLQRQLEHRARDLASHSQAALGKPLDAILILGGTGNAAYRSNGLIIDYGESVDRLLYGAQLYREGLAPRVIVSGGTWPFISIKDITASPLISNIYPPAESVIMRDLLIRLGVPSSAIIEEKNSTTTRENLRFTAQLLQEQGIVPEQQRLALVTSAAHMPRAMMNAEREGMKVAAYPTDWESVSGDYPRAWVLLMPSADSLNRSQKCLKELLALLLNY